MPWRKDDFVKIHRIAAVILSAAVCLSISACGGKSESVVDNAADPAELVSSNSGESSAVSVNNNQYNTASETASEISSVTSSADSAGSADGTSSAPVLHTHSYTSKIIEPTCLKSGYTVYTCSCGDRYTDDRTEPLGHSFTQTETAPTCTESGYTLKTCSRCGTSQKENFTEALGHDFAAVETVAPTCVSSGYTVYKCSRCEFTYKDNYTGALGHDWEDWAITKEPTDHSSGRKIRKCTRCDKTQTETIEMLSGSNDYASEVVALVNAERSKQGLSPLTARKELNEYAQLRSKEIVSNFEHKRPDGSSPLDYVMSLDGVMRAGENIAWGQSSPEEVMTAWMNSEGHRENIMKSTFSMIGVGCYEANGRRYWTQIFAG